ncbi:hypothetical protein Tco_0829889 [Tanacetum coccineum]
MSTMAGNVIAAGSKNRPPMLERSDMSSCRRLDVEEYGKKAFKSRRDLLLRRHRLRAFLASMLLAMARSEMSVLEDKPQPYSDSY